MKKKPTLFLSVLVLVIMLAPSTAQEKPVIALADFINTTRIETLPDRSHEFQSKLNDLIDGYGRLEVRSSEDLDVVNLINDYMDLNEDGDIVADLIGLLNLPQDKQGHLLAQGVDYFGFGVWTANDNMIAQQACFILNLYVVNLETREVITVSRAIDNDVLPMTRNPLLDPPAFDRIDTLLDDVASELSTVLFLEEEERTFRYEIRQLENEAAGRTNGKKFTAVALGMLGFTQLIGGWLNQTYLQVLAFDGYSFVVYLGLRDVYIKKDIDKRVKTLKEEYRSRYSTEI